MDVGNHVKRDRFHRIQAAQISINSRCYPLYKGVNLIGRNKEAVVNIKNVNVSQHHAVIILVDDNQHFVTDFNSSNGTYLYDSPLTPFKLYELTDKAEIKFADVKATYSKINVDTNASVFLHDTMEMTQNVTQSFYGTNTQLLDTLNDSNGEHNYTNSIHTRQGRVDNLHELPTQKMEYPDQIPLQSCNIHDVPTQIIKQPNRNKDCNTATARFLRPTSVLGADFHIAPTQKITLNKAMEDTNDNLKIEGVVEQNCIIENVDLSLHDAPTQVIPFPSNLQDNSVDNSTSQETVINDIDHSEITETKNHTSRNTTLHWSQEATTSGLNKILDDSFPNTSVVNQQVIDDSVIDDSVRESNDNPSSNDSLDFLAMQLMDKVEKENFEANSLKDDTQNSVVNENQIKVNTLNKLDEAGSDSDTDIDEPSTKSMNKPKQSDSSDTDIDEPVIKSKGESKNSSQNSDIVRPKRKKSIKLASQSSATSSGTEIYKLNQESEGSDTDLDEPVVKSLNKLKEQDKLSSSSQDSDIVRPKRKSVPKLADTQIENDDHIEIEKTVETKNDEKLKETKLNDSDIIPATQAESEESFRLGITELMDDDTEKEENSNKMKDNEDKPTNIDNIENNAYVMATQKIDIQENLEAGTSRNISEYDETEFVALKQIDKPNSQHKTFQKFTFKKKQANFDDSLTTILGTNNSEDADMATTQKINDDQQPKSNDSDDAYMAATQRINEGDQSVSEQPKSSDDIYMASTQNINKDDGVFKRPKNKSKPIKNTEDDDDVYLQSTQCLNINTQHTPRSDLLDDDDVYIMPTQKLEQDTQKVTQDDGVFKKPADKLKTVKSVEDDFYLQATQSLNLNSDKSCTSVPTDEDDDVFMMPTQKLELDTQKITAVGSTITTKTTDKVKENEDNFYLQSTQALNIDVEKPSTSKLHAEEQDDVFMMATQKLEIDSAVFKENNETDTQKELQSLNVKVSDISGIRLENPVAHVLSERNENAGSTENIRKDTFQVPDSPISRRSRKTLESKKSMESETLSQIETFIQQTGKSERSNKINHPENNVEDRPETLSQIEAFIDDTSQSKKINRHEKTVESEVERNETRTDGNNSRNRRVSKRRLSNQDEQPTVSVGKLENIPEDNEENDFESSPTKIRKVHENKSENEEGQLNNSKECKSDVDQSFIALLESKNTKARKTRTSNLGQIQATTANRRSMGIAETSVVELAEPATKSRKSVRRTGSSTKLAESKSKPVVKRSEKVLTSTSSGSELSDSEVSDKSNKKGDQKSKKKELDAVKEKSEVIEVTLPARRVTRRNSASSTSSDGAKTNVRNKRKTRMILEDTSDTSEERNKSTEPPSKRKSKVYETVVVKITKNEKMSSNQSESEASSTKTRGRKKTEEFPIASIISDSSEDFSSTNDNKPLAPVTPSKNKRITRAPNEPSTSADNVNTPKRGQRNVSNETLFNSAERAKRKLKPKIVFTMFESPQLESLIKRMGGSVVDSIESSTVLVTQHVKRTQKLLTAVGQGKPICSPDWLNACKKANEFLDPWDHILLDKEAEKKWGFSLKESLLKASSQKLLQNYVFQIMVTNAVDVLKHAIEACGGKCVTKSPSKHSEDNFIIIASPEHKTKYLKVIKQNPDVKVVEPEAIFDGVLRQELRLSRHLLN